MTEYGTRLAELRKALSTEDPLASVRELIPDEGEGVQQVVVYALACKLETNSACLSILFDRFEDEELERIRSSLERIGAARTLADLGELQALFQDSLAAGSDRLDAAELVQEQSNARGIDGRSEAHVEEMEEKLLQFCEAHLEELAAG